MIQVFQPNYTNYTRVFWRDDKLLCLVLHLLSVEDTVTLLRFRPNDISHFAVVFAMFCCDTQAGQFVKPKWGLLCVSPCTTQVLDWDTQVYRAGNHFDPLYKLASRPG